MPIAGQKWYFQRGDYFTTAPPRRTRTASNNQHRSAATGRLIGQVLGIDGNHAAPAGAGQQRPRPPARAGSGPHRPPARAGSGPHRPPARAGSGPHRPPDRAGAGRHCHQIGQVLGVTATRSGRCWASPANRPHLQELGSTAGHRLGQVLSATGHQIAPGVAGDAPHSTRTRLQELAKRHRPPGHACRSCATAQATRSGRCWAPPVTRSHPVELGSSGHSGGSGTR